jgi:Mg-chelatase subunit ChlD
MPEKDQIVVLADVSSSMSTRDGGSHEKKKRIDLLREALSTIPSGVIIIEFSDDAREVTRESLRLDEMGGTALHKGIRAAVRHNPVRTVIISDGEPDSQEDAREAIEELTGIVDVVFCGDPKNTRAVEFLNSLAKAGAGGFYKTGDQIDVRKQLPAVIAGLLNS